MATVRKQLRDLVAMLGLPAVWSGRDAARILEALLDVLRSMLRLDLAYVRSPDPAGGSDLEVTRMQGPDSGTLPLAIASIVTEQLAKRRWSEPPSLAHSVTGELLHAVQTTLTVEGRSGVVVVASRRSSFPTAFERFVLQSAVTQAEIALRNAGLNDIAAKFNCAARSQTFGVLPRRTPTSGGVMGVGPRLAVRSVGTR